MKLRTLRSNKKGSDDAQLLLIAGIILSVAIVTLASVSVSLSNADIAIDKTTFIKSEYDNLRREFGITLKDKIGNKLGYGEDVIRTYFNDTRDTYVFFIESLNGNYFDAEYIGLSYNDNQVDGIICLLRIGNGKEYVSEEITYALY